MNTAKLVEINSFSINALIQKVRDELAATASESKAKRRIPLFQLDKVTIEVNLVVTKAKGNKGGINLSLVTADTRNQFSEQQIHKVTLELSTIKLNEKLKLKSPTMSATQVLKQSKFSSISRKQLEDMSVEELIKLAGKLIESERYFTM